MTIWLFWTYLADAKDGEFERADACLMVTFSFSVAGMKVRGPWKRFLSRDELDDCDAEQRQERHRDISDGKFIFYIRMLNWEFSIPWLLIEMQFLYQYKFCLHVVYVEK